MVPGSTRSSDNLCTRKAKRSGGRRWIGQCLGVCRGYRFSFSRRFGGKDNEMIPQKRILPARRSGYRFTHWLLGACFLAGSAITTTSQATPTILATNQGQVTNIIVDGSRVYWINYNNSAV